MFHNPYAAIQSYFDIAKEVHEAFVSNPLYRAVSEEMWKIEAERYRALTNTFLRFSATPFLLRWWFIATLQDKMAFHYEIYARTLNVIGSYTR